MRSRVRTLVLSTMTFAVIVPVASAQADVCPFPIHEDVLVNTEVPVPDGTGLPGGFVAKNATLTTGRFVTKFTNDSTHYSITSAENGPNWTTDDLTPTPGAKASFTLIGTGNNVETFGPRSQAALAAKGIHVPGLTYASGLLILHVVVDDLGAYVDNFSLQGQLVDGCAVLAAGG